MLPTLSNSIFSGALADVTTTLSWPLGLILGGIFAIIILVIIIWGVFSIMSVMRK